MMFDYDYTLLKKKLETDEGQTLLKRVKEAYGKKYECEPILTLDYAKFKLIYRTGNRTEYETCYFERRHRLALLEILAIAEDRYLEALENVLAAICDEYSWVLPAHSYQDKGKFDYSFIDLFAAETCFYLSEAVVIFGDRLSPDIRVRIKNSLQTKIVSHFESRTFWYECERGTNWTAVCFGSIGIMYLYAFPERFCLVRDRILQMCENYLRGLHDDGVCEEGADYWIYGFGWLSLFMDVYRQKFGALPAFMTTEKVRNTLDYHAASVLDGRFLPFSDVSAAPVTDYSPCELVIKKLFPDTYRLPDYDFCRNAPFTRQVITTRILDSIGRYRKEETSSDEKTAFTRYYPGSGIFLCRNRRYTFLAKGGHNKEMHNHNDAGSVSLYVKGKRILADLGKGKYTLGYFDDPAERYGEKVFVCGSLSHCLPIIDGKYQECGRDRQAILLARSENSVRFEIMSAYGISGESLSAAYTCLADRLRVQYAFSGTRRQLTFRFVSDYAPLTEDGRTVIEGVEVLCGAPCARSVTAYPYETYEGSRVAYALDFALAPADRAEVSFDFLIPER